MHKIKVEQKSLNVKEEELYITDFLEDLELKVRGTVYCAIQNFHNQTIKILLEENSHLTIEFLLDLENTKNKITIENQENSKLDMHYACTYKGTNELVIENVITTSHNENTIQVRAVENDGALTILATGEIQGNTKENTYLEDIKAITTHENSIKIMPDLKVATNSVLANHNATIGPIEENLLFYLESKGLAKESATSLIKEGFLKSNLQEKILKFIGGERDES